METLTKKEEKVMHIFWKLKRGFVKDIIANMKGEKPPYNTISSIVRILSKKEFLSYKQYGNTYEYYPKVSKKKYRKFVFKKMMSNYFDDSYTKVVSFMSKENKLSDKDLNEILKIIEKSEKKKN